MEEEFEAIERTLCQLPQVHVFKIPVRMTAEGHRAADWPKDPAWTGKLRIVAKGKIASIILFDEQNPAFAVCHVTDDAAIERTLDSGRYFVLRITNNAGRHAFIGIAFNERNDAFDFNVALQEHKKETERENEVIQRVSAPSRDLSLKEGEKIKINIASTRTKEKKGSTGGGGGLLAPPPSSSGGLLPKPSAALPTKSRVVSSAPTTNVQSVFDNFGSLSFGDNTPPSHTTSTTTSAASSFSSSTASTWDDFGTFGEKPKSTLTAVPTSAKPILPKTNKDGTVNLLDFDF